MKKIFVTFLFGISLIGSVFADVDTIQMTNGTAVDITTGETITAKENGAVYLQNKLNLPKKDKYDLLIKNNVVSDSVGEDMGAEIAIKNILNPANSDFIKLINYVIGAIAFIWLAVLGGKFIMSGGNEENLSQYKSQFGWILLGLVTVSVAEYAGYKVFNPLTEGNLESDARKFSEITNQIVSFIQYIVGGVALIAGVRSGYVFIIHGDESDAVEKEKEFINIFLFALGLIIFAQAIGTWVNLSDTSNAIDSEKIVKEIVGLINFILMFVSAAALFSIVLSSGYYIISMGNDDLTSRAKKMIINSVIALLIAFSSYTIVSFLT